MYNFGSANVTATVQASAAFDDGTASDSLHSETVTLAPGVNRITVKENNPGVAAWRVEVLVGNTLKASRNYIVKAFAHGFHAFLMLEGDGRLPGTSTCCPAASP